MMLMKHYLSVFLATVTGLILISYHYCNLIMGLPMIGSNFVILDR